MFSVLWHLPWNNLMYERDDMHLPLQPGWRRRRREFIDPGEHPGHLGIVPERSHALGFLRHHEQLELVIAAELATQAE